MKRAHTELTAATSAMPKAKIAKGKYRSPVQPPSKGSPQGSGIGANRRDPPDVYERGQQRLARDRIKPGGTIPITGMHNTAMPRVGHQSATAPGSLARPGSEVNSASMDARSSVPTSIQQGPNTRDQFGPRERGRSASRDDNAEVDANFGTGRGAKGGSYRNLRY